MPGARRPTPPSTRETLLKGTAEWQDLVAKSSLPEWLKIRVQNDLFPLVTNTLQTKDGRFSVLEPPATAAPRQAAWIAG